MTRTKSNNCVNAFDISVGSLLIDNTRDLFFEVCSIDFFNKNIGYVIASTDELVSVHIDDVSPVEFNTFVAKETFNFREVVLSGVFQRLKLVKGCFTVTLDRACNSTPFDVRIFGEGEDFEFEDVHYVHELQKMYTCVTGEFLFRVSSYFERPVQKPLTLVRARTYNRSPQITNEQILEVIRIFKTDKNNTAPAICKKLNLKEHQVHRVLNNYNMGKYDDLLNGESVM